MLISEQIFAYSFVSKFEWISEIFAKVTRDYFSHNWYDMSKSTFNDFQ